MGIHKAMKEECGATVILRKVSAEELLFRKE